MQKIIKHAMQACRRDGYDQIIYQDSKNELAFSRDYPLNNMYNHDTVIGYIEGFYENGIYQTVFIKEGR